MNCRRCDEIYEVDGIEPDCENCDVPILVAVNQEVLELHRTINTAFVKDFSALALVFEVCNIECTRDGARAMLEKLITLHGLIKDREIEDHNREMKKRQEEAKRKHHGR